MTACSGSTLARFQPHRRGDRSRVAERNGQHVQAFLSRGSPAVQAPLNCRPRKTGSRARRKGHDHEDKYPGDHETWARSDDGRSTHMAPHDAAPKAADSKPGSKPDAKDDLKSLPLAEVEKKLGSSPDGLSQAEAQKRLTQYGPNEIEEKKTNRVPEIPQLFLGSHPVDDRSGGDPVGGGPALAGFWHHPRSACWPTPWSDSGKNTRRATPSPP